MANLAARIVLLATASGLLLGGAHLPTPPPVAPGFNAPICHPAIPDPAGVPDTLAGWARDAQIFPGLGDRTRPISTPSADAQAYFNQGMRWLWAFNHDEATRSFARAAMLDPQCPMCFWGVALTIGPNYNDASMSAPRGRVAFAALRQAQLLAPLATPVEQALIAALARRYPDAGAVAGQTYENRQQAYAAAMRRAARQFPDDMDVQTLTAEALMGLHAWHLWQSDGTASDGTPEILALLEGVLARDPSHPGANHYYIHAVEASPDPGRAVAAAERLRGAMPGAGHLEHMPAHIFERVGRYEDSAEANRRGAAADLQYFALTRPPDTYVLYTAHNYEFLALSAAMEGRREETIAAMRRARAAVSTAILVDAPAAGWVMGELYAGMVRFGLWQMILAEKPPDPRCAGLTFTYLWATGMAHAALGQAAGAASALAQLQAIDAASASADPKHELAKLVLRARLAQAARDDRQAITLLRQAVTIEDGLGYFEPPLWFVPTRHVLGAALLRGGDPVAAEAVYREDLRRIPENGWSLLGLSQALAAQAKPTAAMRHRLQRAWANADTAPASSAL
jgi:tetratricopeptide (TPR) repeat protein